MDNNTIISMLEKADAQPFYFGGDNESYFWRAANIEDEIFAQRVWCDGRNNVKESFYYCLVDDTGSRQDIYDDIVIDFVVYYADFWRHGCGYVEGAFDTVAGKDDRGLSDILIAFGKSYNAFVNDVMFWYSIVLESMPISDDDVIHIREKDSLKERDRIAKHVVDRLSVDGPLTITQGNTTFVWRIVEASGKLWFSKHTSRSYDGYSFHTEEYGSIKPFDEDEFNALRDSVSSCFAIDGWSIDANNSNPEDLLCLVNLSLETI